MNVVAAGRVVVDKKAAGRRVVVVVVGDGKGVAGVGVAGVVGKANASDEY